MSGIRSYDLSGDQVESLVSALSGNEEERTKWFDKLSSWIAYRNRQIEILHWAEEWFKEYAIKTGVHLGRHDWSSDEENLMDWVYYQMEYAGGLCWDKDSEKVIVNKYSSSKPMVSGDSLNDMLGYITRKVKP